MVWMDVCERDKAPMRGDGYLGRRAWGVWGNGHEGTARRNGHWSSILFPCSLLSSSSSQGRMLARLGAGERDCSDDSSTRPRPPPKIPDHQYPSIVFTLCSCSLGRSAWWWPAPAIMPAPDDVRQLPQSFVSAVEKGWRPPSVLRAHAPRLLHYLTQGDGGPVGRAPMRLRLRGGV